MATGPNQRVVPYGKKWAIKAQGSERATATFDTKEEAMQRARQIAKNYGSKVISHRENGTMHMSSKPTKSSAKRKLVEKKTSSKTAKKTVNKPAPKKKGFLARLFNK
jgi:hypothetical protein